MNDVLREKLKELPTEPGVYFHKSADGEIIYVGKAAVLKNRVRQYFQQSRNRDLKTDALVAEIHDTDWMVVESEIEALFLEAEMVRRYMPRYNILLRDDKSLSYIRIDYDTDYPTVTTTRRPLDDKARYFGPYFSVSSVREALRLLRRVFPFATKKSSGVTRESLSYHLGLDPGLESGKTSLAEYRANLRKLMAVIEGKRKTIEREIERDMARAAKTQDYESARIYRNQLFALRALGKAVIFSDKEFLDISKDHALNELAELLSLYERPRRAQADGVQGVDEKRTKQYEAGTATGVSQSTTKQSAAISDSAASSAGRQDRELRLLRRIEGYDISHMSGTNVVASMVTFTNGVSDKGEYRKFKTTKDHNNDFYNMHETLTRRLSEKNIKAWGCPDLILIDGGKGQLDAALRAREEQAAKLQDLDGLDEQGDERIAELKKCAGKISSVPFVGLAKREEQIVIHKEKSGVTLNQDYLRTLGGYFTESDNFILVNVPHSTNVVKLLQRIRDESHRFAVSYHSTLKQKSATTSILDTIPGVGPTTRKQLIKKFGSGRGVQTASEEDIIAAMGPKRGRSIYEWLHGK